MKTSIAILCIAGLIILGVILAKLSGCETNKTAATSKATQTILQHPQAPILARYTDSSGAHHIQVAAGANTVPGSALTGGITANTFLDSAARAMKVKDDQLQELTRENLQLRALVQLKPQGPAADSVMSYSDKWLKLQYYLKTGQAKLSYNVSITTGKFTPASWLPFAHKPPLLDISADDPRATINSVDHISVTVPEPLFGFGADVKAQYLYNSRLLVPGIGANIRIGRFHLEDRAYYNAGIKQAFGVSYDLLKINP